MWELDHKEGWRPKNLCFWTLGLEKTLESPMVCKEIKPVNLKGDQSGIFIGRTDAEAEAPILWWIAVKSWLISKDPDAGKDWRQEEKGTTEDEIVEWHHWLNGHEFEHAPGDGEGQGKPSVLQSMESQRAGHDWVTEQQQLYHNLIPAPLQCPINSLPLYSLVLLFSLTINVGSHLRAFSLVSSPWNATM